MKILLDTNLSPDWRGPLVADGHDVVHGSEVGRSNAPDAEIIKWAAERGFVVFTHDLDFSAILAATKGIAPTVLQMRTQSPVPGTMGAVVREVLAQLQRQLEDGAIVVIDESRTRVRLLPLRK